MADFDQNAMSTYFLRWKRNDKL